MEKDLLESDLLLLPIGAEVTEFEIVDRVTDRKAKTDVATISMEIDHPDAMAKRGYTMEYILSDEGWTLESVNDYEEGEVVWETNPKSTPTEEEVFSALQKASREAMDLYYAEYVQASACGYFFDENCTMLVLQEDTVQTAGKHTYTATVTTNREWKNVKVTETEEAHFVFNPKTFAWEFTDYVILNVDADWNIDGEYHTEAGVTIGVEVGENVSAGSDADYFGFDFVFANKSKSVFTYTTASGVTYTHALTQLWIPCSKGIATSAANFETDGTKGLWLGGVEFVPDGTKPIEPVNAQVTIYPEKITYQDQSLSVYRKEILSK
ncbi:MAG: hypothetical protein E7428_03275 [Ruminococcaceae bacterium]|nr:hypothetical protein [Oscillospiraceae bacterium]